MACLIFITSRSGVGPISKCCRRSRQRTTSTETGDWLSAPSATLPNSRYRTPLAPLAPTTSSCARLVATAPRRSRSGSPWTSIVRVCHPIRLSPAAPRLSSFVAARDRIVFWRLTSCAMLAAPGTRPREGGVNNSTALTSVTRPPRGGTSRPTNARARIAASEVSTPTTIVRTCCDRRTTSTGARGTADDTSRDAAHEQATNRPMSAPADHDDVRLETFGCAKNSLDGRLVRDFNFDVRPAA